MRNNRKIADLKLDAILSMIEVDKELKEIIVEVKISLENNKDRAPFELIIVANLLISFIEDNVFIGKV